MALVVFLRAVNVGGRVVRTRELAAGLGLSNLGAAGTLVAPARSDAARLTREVRRALPFDTEVIVRPGSEILALLASDFQADAARKGLKRFVTVLARRPGGTPALPVEEPEGAGWRVRLLEVRGPHVLSLLRPGGARGVYPNALVERAFGIPATTRGWPTLEAIGHLLREHPAPPVKKARPPRSALGRCGGAGSAVGFAGAAPPPAARGA